MWGQLMAYRYALDVESQEGLKLYIAVLTTACGGGRISRRVETTSSLAE